MADMGDNSGVLSSEAVKELKALSERIINLLNDRDAVNADLKEIYQEVADGGFDKAILRKAVAKARKDAAKVRTEDEMVDMYLHAIQGDLFGGE